MSAANTVQTPSLAQAELDTWTDYLRAEGKRPATVWGYHDVARKFLNAYPARRFSEFTQEDVLRYLEATDERHRGRTASVIRGWFRWGELTGQIIDVRNPTRHLPKYKWARAGAVRELFSEAEITRLKGLPHPDGVLMEILLETGVKTGEARSLTGKCCELDVPQLRVIQTAAPRPIPITDLAFRDRLQRMLQVETWDQDDYLWYAHPGGSRDRRHNRAISQGAIQKWWGRCVEVADVPHRMMRTTRNTFARRMINDGVPLDDLTLWLGHNDYYTTNEYYADGRYADARKRIFSMKEATGVIRHQRDLLQRVLPHLLTASAPTAMELAKEISAELTERP